MATNHNGPVLAERTDIHKSCKSLETLLTLFNDYCEAAAGVVVLQKKLAKALRETAGLKVTGDIASNALNASANVFEALSDIDTKYVKIVDKEYDNISAEVKKWFKKLAKEEKLHDERMANANARIKQAGQVYEKKSKKKTTDVTEEHARYINLISTLGPEVSQEKYNHTLNVTQRHTTTTYSVAACLARVADAEWLRTCEGVRRFAPTIGQLGEWRSLCEGGWTGPLPQDLPDIDAGPQPPQQQPLLHQIVSPSLQPPQQREQLDRSDDVEHPPPPSTHRDPRDSRESTEQARFEGRPPGYSSDVDLTAPQREYLSTSSRNSPTLQWQNQSFTSTSSGGQDRPTLSTAPSSFEPPKPASVDPNTGSVRSLSAFPSPPTHFPLPPPRASQLQQQAPSQSPDVSFSTMSHVTESPVSVNHELAPAPVPMPTPTTDARAAAPPSPLPNRDRDSPISARGSGPPSPEQQFKERLNTQNSSNSPSETAARPIPVRSQTIVEEQTQLSEEQLYPPSTGIREPQMSSSPTSTGLSYSKGDYFDVGREFGVIGQSSKSKTMDPTRSPVMERSDTGVSTGSKVAAIRSRYSNNSGSTSPPPRDLPKLPLSVNDLASRYQLAEDPSSPLPRTRSPPMARQLSLPPLESSPHTRQPPDSYREQDRTPQVSASVGGYQPQLSASTTSLTPTPEEETRRRRQRINELAEFELKEKERELRERERDIELRARELELDRARLMGLQEGATAVGNDERLNSEQSPIGLRPREKRSSLRQQMQRPLSQVDVRSQNQAQARASQEVRPHSQYSYSATNLAPPNPSSPRYNPTSSQSPSPSHYQSQTRDLHTQYEHQDQHQGDPWRHQNPSTSSSSSQYPQQQPARKPENTLRSPITATPEKKGGWMRRLSMPGAFNLDSKKNHNNVGGGIVGGKGISSADMKHNSSSTNLRTGGPQEDGRVAAGVGRRSYDAGGVSNRSVTNLGRR